MNDTTKLTELVHALRRIAKVSYGATIEEGRSVSKTQREAADLIEQQVARIAELEAQLAAVAPAVDAQPVAWLTKCKNSGLVEQAEPGEKATNPEFWTDAFPVYEYVQSEQGLRKALTEIAEQEHIELMLDPMWAQRVAIAALAKQQAEG